MTITSPGTTNVTVNIDTLANRHLISPYIYGINTMTPTSITGMSPIVGSLWRQRGLGLQLETLHLQCGRRLVLRRLRPWRDRLGYVDAVTVNSGSHMLTTMPMLGWVAKDSENSSNHNWSYSVATYGAQCKTDPNNPDAGNGQKPDCRTPITTNTLTNAYYPLVDTPATVRRAIVSTAKNGPRRSPQHLAARLANVPYHRSEVATSTIWTTNPRSGTARTQIFIRTTRAIANCRICLKRKEPC